MLEEAQSIDKFWEYIKHILSVCLYHMWEAEIFFFLGKKKVVIPCVYIVLYRFKVFILIFHRVIRIILEANVPNCVNRKGA